jgi:threonine dehydratase
VDAPVSKIGPAARLGARVHTLEGSVDECAAAAREFAEENDVLFIHPFDDADVIAGQGTVGLELLDQIEDLAQVVVPLGGGGLLGGTAIAVKAPGELTLPLVERLVDDVVVVSDDEAGDAMALLLAEGKLVVEGAGAVGMAALMCGRVEPVSSGTTAVVLSGGNIDEEVLMEVARRSEIIQGRGAVLFTRISDRPGGLARLLEQVAAAGANLVDVRHLREGVELHMAETGVELVVETRGAEHARDLVETLREAGYPVEQRYPPSEGDADNRPEGGNE